MSECVLDGTSVYEHLRVRREMTYEFVVQFIQKQKCEAPSYHDTSLKEKKEEKEKKR